MKFKFFVLAALTAVLFYQCDPTKKLYKSEEYLGTIDTVINLESYEDENYEGDDYDYTEYDDYSYSNDTVVSEWSASLYQASAKRVNDLIDTKLDVSFDWAKAWMYGKATLTFKPYFYATNTLTLDAKGFTVKEVSLVTPNGKTPLKYVYNTDSIPDTMQMVIDLGRTFTRNETYTIYIDYIAKPNDLPLGGSAAITSDKGLYFINNEGKEANKPKQIWTQGETEATSCWCPTIDKPNERCTNNFFITVEDKYQTLSNGVLVSSKKNADGTRTDNWKMDLPHAPYLFMMAVGEFTIVKDTWKGMPVNYYVEKEYEGDAKGIFGNTPEMIEFYSNLLGVKYVWPKYSQVVVRDYVSGAMENTTATIHGEFLQQHSRDRLDENYEDVVSHELFHQWFGDLVTCESWSNLPLNESFATYGEYLWREYKYGRDDADYTGMNDLNTYLGESEYKQVDMIRFNYETREDMFDSHSYAKGGRILHMLRKYIGDEAFYAGLKKYLEDNKYTAVEIHQLRLAMEAVTGEDLNWFFNQWFLNSGHPDLGIYYEYSEDLGSLTVTLYQNQDTSTTPIYVLPMAIDIYSNGKVERQNIVMDKAVQSFTFAASTRPDLVNVDAEKMLLCTKIDTKFLDEYVFQYNNAPLFKDRYEAVENLAIYQSENDNYRKLIEAALNDKHWAIRQAAVDTLLIDENTTQAIKDKIMDMAKNDPRSYVRSAALNKLKEITGIDAWAMYNAALNDSSYTVVSTAMYAINNNDKKAGLEIARKLKTEDNFSVSYAVMGILGESGEAIDNGYFIEQFKNATGYDSYFTMLNYEPYLQRMTDSYIINAGADELKKIAEDDSNFWISFTANSILTGLVSTYQAKLETETDPQIQKSLQASIDYITKIVQELGSGDDTDY
jgi:aminopeptidase N